MLCIEWFGKRCKREAYGPVVKEQLKKTTERSWCNK